MVRLDGTRHRLDPRAWPLWANPPAVLALVLGVETLAVVLTLTLATEPLGPGDLRTFVLLTTGALLHHEVARHVERLREISADGKSYVDLKSMWTFAALLLLPLGPTLALVAITFVSWWLRVSTRPVVHRWVFSGASVMVASVAARLVLDRIVDVHAGALVGPWSLLAVIAAALTRWAVNVGLVAAVLALSAPTTRRRERLGSRTDNLLILGALALGAVLAELARTSPWLIPVLLLPLLTMHRGFLVHQLARAAHTDPKTGLATAKHWQANAARHLLRARRHRVAVGVLMVDLDEFKRVNDTWGHLAGDEVLRAVADALRDELRAEDSVGRFGGEEFVVLLDDLERLGLPTDTADVPCACTGPGRGRSERLAAATAERLRRRVRTVAVTVATGDGPVTVDGLSVSVGVATTPDTPDSLDDLVLAADNALYEAKRAGRDRVRCAPVARPGA